MIERESVSWREAREREGEIESVCKREEHTRLDQWTTKAKYVTLSEGTPLRPYGVADRRDYSIPGHSRNLAADSACAAYSRSRHLLTLNARNLDFTAREI